MVYKFKTSKKRSSIMQKIKSNKTAPEILLQKALRKEGVKFKRNYTKLYGAPDIVLAEKKIAIFVDGEFWHGYQWKKKKKKIKANRLYWIPKIERTILRDRQNNQNLKKDGWKVVRFWQKQIEEDLPTCLSKVKDIIEEKPKIISLFTGCGGLDLGFKKAGFDVALANEFDRTIWDTFSLNFPDTALDKRDIRDIPSSEIPMADGIIGGPPCQSWSEAGAGRGLNDCRGKLFFEYIRILKDKEPLFFLAENVSGILLPRHRESFDKILNKFRSLNYNVSYELLNAKDYNVPQDRKRVIIVGYHKKMGKSFNFPKPSGKLIVLRDAIGDLKEPKPAKLCNKTNDGDLKIPNHEYMIGGFSTIYMSRNRVRGWNEQSFTIQAGGRHAPIHPKAPKMKFIEQNKRVFIRGKEHLYRRLSVRECARIQTFPDSFIFKYDNISDGYKMVGNAVPVEFARILAKKIMLDLKNYKYGLKIGELFKKSLTRSPVFAKTTK